MLVDRYRGQHSTTSGTAVSEFEKAVFAVAAHRPAAAALKAAIKADENLVAGHALKGFGVALLGKAEDLAASHRALEQARASLVRVDGGTDFERALVKALELTSQGSFKAAAARLEARVADHPNEFLCLKLANALRFMTGEPKSMRQTTSNALAHWDENDAGYGFVLGLHAFGLEETGSFAEAEAIGRQAVAAEPADAWGVHAVSHVMEMRGRPGDGADWLESSRDLWPKCNNFGFHLAWHLALFRMESAEYDAVLKLYDQEIRPTETDDFRDMSNAVSLLWRLQQEGVDVGNRWQGVHDIAYSRRTDTTYIFASLHYLLALLGAGDRSAAHELVENLKARAKSPANDDQAQVAAEVGVAFAELIVRLHSNGGHVSDMCDVALRLPAVGGSRAQRDVFVRTLMMLAAESGEAATFDAVTRLRCAMKTEDRFVQLTEQRLIRRTAKPQPLQRGPLIGHA